MKVINVCVVGAGNISNTRHIPALKKVKGVEIIGVLSNKIDKSYATAKKNNISNYASIDNNIKKALCSPDINNWFNKIDAVVIGAPPLEHYTLVKSFLELGKHVLVEKPMMMTET